MAMGCDCDCYSIAVDIIAEQYTTTNTTTAAATTTTTTTNGALTNLVAANSGSVVIPHSSSSAGSGGGDYDLVPISPIHCSIQPGLLSSAGSFGGAGLSLSFGSRFYPGISPGQVINSLECILLLCQVFALIVLILLFIVLNNDSPNEFKCRLSSSIKSDHGLLIHALSGDFGGIREDEFVRLFFYFLLIC